MTAYDGGYLMIKQPLIKEGTHAHTAALENPVSPLMLQAVNIIQSVRWRINTFVLDVMREAYVNGDTIGDLPPSDDLPLPPPLPDDVWEKMSKEERAGHKAKLAEIHGLNARFQAKRESILRKLQIAEELRDEPYIWFPHNLDFRGRIYPLPQDLHPQSDDTGKALLMFADGKEVGPKGGYWLKVALANAFGHDKISFDERVEWVNAHMNAVVDSAADPLNGRRWWTEADEPWCALALCREIVGLNQYGEAWISHYPVCLDGSCNGLQHLAAMGRDPVGARATNLCDLPEKQDLYSQVGKEVVRLVERDAAEGIEEARNWLGKIDRKTVKRAVMTTPYGVTQRGIRNQLIADRHTVGLDGSPIRNADYLKDKIVEALENTVRSARDIMGYIQGVAKALAEADLPLRWTTPAGMTVQQAYYNKNRTSLDTLFGRAQIWSEDPNLGLNVRKQTLASAPNVIHSFDAAHLTLTVVTAKAQGIDSFCFIHDSYGTHAADVDRLATILREQFVSIYSENVLEKFDREIREYAPGIELPELPKLGEFDVTEVLRAPYFFS